VITLDISQTPAVRRFGEARLAAPPLSGLALILVIRAAFGAVGRFATGRRNDSALAAPNAFEDGTAVSVDVSPRPFRGGCAITWVSAHD
jgi:hypothetical protein